MLPVTPFGLFTAAERHLNLMIRDELTEAACIESKRRGSSEAAHHRGMAEGYKNALKVLRAQLAMKAEPVTIREN